jgi:electron transfer flavoprotein beta subunit
MDILVLVKKVPDPNLPDSFVSLSESGDAVVLHPSSQHTINLYDLNAVECAIALKEAHGGTVTVLTADDASADAYLRRAMSMGADKAVRVELDPALRGDAHATAKALAGAIQQGARPDLILAGRAASDTDAGYVPYLVAARLDIPALGPIVAVSEASAERIVAGKLTDTSIDDYEVILPALLLVSNEINKPRTPSIKGVMVSKKAVIEVVSGLAVAREGAMPTFARKPGRQQAETVVLKDSSDDDKAAALLAALGY